MVKLEKKWSEMLRSYGHHVEIAHTAADLSALVSSSRVKVAVEEGVIPAWARKL